MYAGINMIQNITTRLIVYAHDSVGRLNSDEVRVSRDNEGALNIVSSG